MNFKARRGCGEYYEGAQKFKETPNDAIKIRSKYRAARRRRSSTTRIFKTFQRASGQKNSRGKGRFQRSYYSVAALPTMTMLTPDSVMLDQHRSR